MPVIPSKRLRLREADVYVPVLLFLGALIFRLMGIRWGLANALHNQSYHPDEIPIWAASQQINPAALSFTPGFYNYGTLYLTLLRLASGLVWALTGPIRSGDANAFWGYVSACHLAGRAISAVAGSAMSTGVFFLTKRWTSMFGATCAGLLIAVAPAHVVHSRFQTVDILAACLLTFSTLFALRILPNGTVNHTPARNLVQRNAVLSGTLAGLSAATKYTGILGLLTLWAALVIARPKNWVMEGLKGSVAGLTAFIVGAPGIVLDNARFMRDFTFELIHTRTGHGLEFAETSNGYFYHLANLFAGLGFLMTLLGLAALVYAAFLKKSWALALLAFFVPYCVVIGGSEVKFLRYTFPIYIALSLSFGWLMGASNRKRGVYGAVVALGFLGLGGFDSGGFRWAAIDTLQMASADARDSAGAYLRSPGVGKNKVVGLVSDPWFWTPAIFADSSLPRSAGAAIYRSMQGARDPRVVRTFPPLVEQWDSRLLTDIRPDYVTFSNYETANLERIKAASPSDPTEKLQVDRYTDFAKNLVAGYVLERQFGSTSAQNPGVGIPDMMYVMPEISIWKRKVLH